jgi:hypothetical protein
MRLTYTGPRPSEGSALPLPEGWPAFDHDEPDEARAREKVASGSYSAPAAKPAARPAKED